MTRADIRRGMADVSIHCLASEIKTENILCILSPPLLLIKPFDEHRAKNVDKNFKQNLDEIKMFPPFVSCWLSPSDHILSHVTLGVGFIYLCKSPRCKNPLFRVFTNQLPPHLAIIWTKLYLSISFFPGFFVIFTTGFAPLGSRKYCNKDVELK